MNKTWTSSNEIEMSDTTDLAKALLYKMGKCWADNDCCNHNHDTGGQTKF